MTAKAKKGGNSVSRREFLKLSGTVAAALQVGAAAGAGLASGKDPAFLTRLSAKHAARKKWSRHSGAKV